MKIQPMEAAFNRFYTQLTIKLPTSRHVVVGDSLVGPPVVILYAAPSHFTLARGRRDEQRNLLCSINRETNEVFANGGSLGKLEEAGDDNAAILAAVLECRV